MTIAGQSARSKVAAMGVAALLCAQASAQGVGPYEYFGGLDLSPAAPSPRSVLGYDIGQRYTRHSDVVEYLRRLDESSDRVRMQRYGSTHEGRPLHILTISSPANLARLDEILENNRALSDPATDDARTRRIVERNPSIVWLSYNVHGNEGSSSECAMQVAYTLVAASDPEVREILDSLVVVIDPMLNPDGRDRYVNWFNMTVGVNPDPTREAAEHDEPWPGGRTNHYYFDLNRDWLWGVHPESRARVALYREYLPHLHVDYHEQGVSSPYFFGAGDEPYNANIAPETREWINLYGEANAAVFDRVGHVYSTRERFDYLYPGYGKVLPTYHGAVGLLCEKGGHSSSGLAVNVRDEWQVTLTDRVQDHFLTSMSYLETSAANRKGQLERFRRFWTGSMSLSSDGGPSAFFISSDTDPSLLGRTWALCAMHGIEIESIPTSTRVEGLRDYRSGEEIDGVMLPAGSWVIRADQRMGRLARAIFERETHVSAIETYDITGWSVPVSFGLDAWWTTGPVTVRTSPLSSWTPPVAAASGAGTTAIVIDADQHRFPAAAGVAAEMELFCRAAGDDFEVDGRVFGAGSMIVHGVRNTGRDLDAFVERCTALGVRTHRLSSTLSTGGHVVGADDNRHWRLPRVMLLRGEGTSSYSYGQHWHLLDIGSPYPYSAVNLESLGSAPLEDYDVVVIPEAFGIGGRLGDGGVDRLKEWVRDGGCVVASGSSAAWAEESLIGIDDEENEESEEDDRPKPSELTFKEREDRNNEDNIPGPMLKVSIDTTHPLAAGTKDWVGVIKRGDRTLRVRDNGYVVARFEDSPRIGGYISDRNAERIGGEPFMTHHRVGRGVVVCFSDDVTFRGFEHAPMRLLLNAIIYGSSL